MKKITYKPLWKTLIDKKLKKCDLIKIANISSSSIAKLGKDETVNTEILMKICNSLNCELSEIMELEEN